VVVHVDEAALVAFRPIASRPRLSVFGTRPTDTIRRSASSVCALPSLSV
jgi:hypothetical protein